MVAGLWACTEDYKDWLAPQSNAGSEPTQTLAMTVQPTVSIIDFATETSERIQLFTTNLTQGQADSYTVGIAPADSDVEPITILADASGYVSADELSNVVATLFGKAPVERTLSVLVTTIATASTPDGNVKVRRVGTPYTLKAKLNVPVIAPAYYLIGGPNDWQSSAVNRSIKFNHSGKDVYDDPVFTVVFDAAASGDTWFAIGDDQSCDAIANNDWSQLYGIVGGDNEAKEGKLARRSEMGGAENSFKVAAGARKIRVTINMLEGTFKVEAVNIADAYYIIGGNGSWNSDKSQKFSHSDRDVFEDPVFTYVLTGGSELWFAFGEAEALDATDNGDWNQLYGYVGEQGNSGSFDRRSVLGGEYTFHLDGAAKFYRFSINVLAKTYEITPLNFAEYFYEIGNESGWSTSHPLYGANGDGKYLGYYYLDGEFKFKPNVDNWNDDLEFVSGDAMGGTLTSGGGPNCPDPGAGFYQVVLDAASLSYTLAKVNTISIIGTVNGNWDTDTDLTFNRETGAWEVTTELAAGNMKFRMNHDWAISWGGSNGDATAFDNLTEYNGKDLAVEAGTYKIQLFITYEGNNKVVMTKQ